MLLFGHIGITVGAALAAQRIYTHFHTQSSPHTETAGNSVEVTRDVSASDSSVRELFDLRIWLIGSILPDIIDKPLAVFTGDGRLLAHSLIFSGSLFAGGLFLAFFRKRLWLFALSLASMIHLVLDSMWKSPQDLFWPFYGFSFTLHHDGGWFTSIVHEFLENPAVYIPEIVGMLIILGYLGLVIMKKYGNTTDQYRHIQQVLRTSKRIL